MQQMQQKQQMLQRRVGNVLSRCLKEWRKRRYGELLIWIDGAQQLGLRTVEREASLRAGGRPSVTERGIAMWSLVKAAIRKLRPVEERGHPAKPEWVQYLVLRDAYIEGKQNSAIMKDLSIGEGTLERARRSGIDRIAQIIAEEEALLNESPA